jgi:hypothetical protein
MENQRVCRGTNDPNFTSTLGMSLEKRILLGIETSLKLATLLIQEEAENEMINPHVLEVVWQDIQEAVFKIKDLQYQIVSTRK